MSYTMKVKGKVFWKTFRDVIEHGTDFEVESKNGKKEPIPPRMWIRLADKTLFIIADITRRDWALCADYYANKGEVIDGNAFSPAGSDGGL
jgi:hypothetical protein